MRYVLMQMAILVAVVGAVAVYLVPADSVEGKTAVVAGGETYTAAAMLEESMDAVSEATEEVTEFTEEMMAELPSVEELADIMPAAGPAEEQIETETQALPEHMWQSTTEQR